MEPSCLRCPPSYRMKTLTLRHACVVFTSRIERQRHRKLFMECIRRDAHNAQRVRGASSPNQCPNPSRPGLGSGGAHDSMCLHSTCRNRTLPVRLGLGTDAQGHCELWGSSLAICPRDRRSCAHSTSVTGGYKQEHVHERVWHACSQCRPKLIRLHTHHVVMQ